MVLEGGSTPEENFTTDTPPSSDRDPYGEQNPPFTSTRQPSFAPVGRDGNEKIYVNLANLPRPFSLLGTANHPPVLVESIQDSCRFAQQVLKRPPRQEEADAFAFHAAKTYRIASYGSPMGIALASMQFYRTMDTFRFPGYTPFKEGSWFQADRFGPLRGQAARYGWHIARLGMYCMMGSVAGAVFMGSYALSVSLAGRATDPRLRDFTQRLKELQKEGTKMSDVRRQQDADSTTQHQQETFEQRRQRRSVQAMDRSGGESKGNSYGDDMSPTGGAFGAEYTEPSSDTGLMNDDQTRKQQTQQQADMQSSPTENTANTFDMDTTAPRSVAPIRSSTGQGQQQQEARQSGSAWERLRQQAGSNNNSNSNRSQPPASSSVPARGQGEQRQGSTVGDSFSFSESDEERQLARSEAQRDFDARIDREREGRDFEDRGRGKKSW